MNKCITCKKMIKEKLWCDLVCKQKFLEEHYSEHQLEVALTNIRNRMIMGERK